MRFEVSVAQKATFEKVLGQLVEHLRQGSDDGAKTRRLVRRAVKAVARRSVTLEPGLVFRPQDPDTALASRMHALGVETITVADGANEDEVLALAHALASDEWDLPQASSVEVSMVVPVNPGELAGIDPEPPQDFRLVVQESDGDQRAPRLTAGSGADFARLADALEAGAARGAWTEALHAAQALIRLSLQSSDTKRGQVGIAVRRLLTPPVLRAFIDHAVRTPEERDRTVEVLEWVGREAGEVMVDSLRESGAIGPKRFLLDVAPRIPDVSPMATALFQDGAWQRVRMGALLLGALGDPGAIRQLVAQQEHPNSRVRLAVVQALGQLGTSEVLDPLKERLSDSHPAVRVAAVEALAQVGAGGVVMVLAGALAEEDDATVRSAIIASLGQIDTSEVAAVLATAATSRKGLLRRRGLAEAERIAAVEALGRHNSRGAQSALERLAAEGDKPVRNAARRALEGAEALESRRDAPSGN